MRHHVGRRRICPGCVYLREKSCDAGRMIRPSVAGPLQDFTTKPTSSDDEDATAIDWRTESMASTPKTLRLRGLGCLHSVPVGGAHLLAKSTDRSLPVCFRDCCTPLTAAAAAGR